MRASEKEPGVCSWPQQVLTAYPDETLQGIIPKLDKVSGLPVIDRLEGKVVGVISRKVSPHKCCVACLIPFSYILRF